MDFISDQNDIPSNATLAWESGDALRRRVPGAPHDPFHGHSHHQSPGESIDSFDQGRLKGVFGDEEDYPFTITPKRYTPWVNLLPRYWVPFITTTNLPSRAPLAFLPVGVYMSATTGASDPLRHYGWSAGINYRSDANFVGASASFTLNRWIPIYSAGINRYALPSIRLQKSLSPGSMQMTDIGRYWEKRHSGWVSVNYPYTPKTWIFARYAYTTRQNLDDIPEGAMPQSGTQLPMRGATGQIQGGWRYSWGQPTRYAISPEDARIFSLVGSITHPYLGTYVLDDDDNRSGLTQFQLTTELREYIVNPWIPNHVFAMRFAGGVTLGSNTFFGNYQLGGSAGDSAFYVIPDEARMLRGYPRAATVGDMYWLTGLEYRFPIARIDRGWGVIPAFLRALSGNVFIDAGNAFTNVEAPGDVFDATLVGVGAELRLSTYLVWGYGITGRAGFAAGLTGEGFRPIFVSDDGTKRVTQAGFLFSVGRIILGVFVDLTF